ncbi:MULTISPECIES: hypothetical protein [Nostoc]|uniref:Uncharacterized protein n=1 Tax=Nostoc paludosum FACHB-159 TaxID=2692908 RepID=A0ABR8KAA7_9NOSO|nr:MULTISPECIES: hypothetical protein [Nostoc]MBD2680163.1 hypothetical protein [Nostoc sp. FACHB-857]MBD2736430.1 hypothetical protein [Nostoc paludosum FACHB-159]
MSIVVIGDRATGKTSMVRALSENGKYVKVSDGKNLAGELYNPDTKAIASTTQLEQKGLKSRRIIWIFSQLLKCKLV